MDVSCHRPFLPGTSIIIIIIIIIITAIEFSLGGSSPYTSTDMKAENIFKYKNLTKNRAYVERNTKSNIGSIWNNWKNLRII